MLGHWLAARSLKKVLIIVSSFCLLSVFGGNAAQCLTPPARLLGWWPGDNNSFDLHLRNHAVPFNSLTYGTGKVGAAFRFNGAFAHLRVRASAPYFQPKNEEFTLTMWVNSAPIVDSTFRVLVNQRIDNDQTAPILLLIDNRGAQSPFSSMLGTCMKARS